MVPVEHKLLSLPQFEIAVLQIRRSNMDILLPFIRRLAEMVLMGVTTYVFIEK